MHLKTKIFFLLPFWHQMGSRNFISESMTIHKGNIDKDMFLILNEHSSELDYFILKLQVSRWSHWSIVHVLRVMQLWLLERTAYTCVIVALNHIVYKLIWGSEFTDFTNWSFVKNQYFTLLTKTSYLGPRWHNVKRGPYI